MERCAFPKRLNERSDLLIFKQFDEKQPRTFSLWLRRCEKMIPRDRG
jgi:hypothetical protein